MTLGMTPRQALADALRAKLELRDGVESTIRIRLIAMAYKLIVKGVDRYTFITTMDKENYRQGSTGRATIKEISDMPEYQAWKE